MSALMSRRQGELLSGASQYVARWRARAHPAPLWGSCWARIGIHNSRRGTSRQQSRRLLEVVLALAWAVVRRRWPSQCVHISLAHQRSQAVNGNGNGDGDGEGGGSPLRTSSVIGQLDKRSGKQKTADKCARTRGDSHWGLAGDIDSSE